jgi:hypothetical protein
MKTDEKVYMLRTLKIVLMTTLIAGFAMCVLLIVPAIYLFVFK